MQTSSSWWLLSNSSLNLVSSFRCASRMFLISSSYCASCMRHRSTAATLPAAEGKTDLVLQLLLELHLQRLQVAFLLQERLLLCFANLLCRLRAHRGP